MKRVFILFVLLLIATMFSCRQVVTDQFAAFEPVPVVNAVLIVEEPLKIHVSLAEKLDDNQLGFVDNANVDLYVDGIFAESLAYVDSGNYIALTIVEVEKEYTCKVSIPDYETVECSQYVPNYPVLKNIEHINVAGKDEEGTSYPALKITFNNEPGSEAFYEVEIRTIHKFRDQVDVYYAGLETIVDPVILNEGLPIALFCNELIIDEIYTLDLNYTTFSSQSSGGPYRTSLYPIVVELRRVTEDYYRFKKQLYLYESGLLADGILTTMTNANLYSNVSSGYGAFVAYSYAVSDTITPNTESYYD